MICELRRHAAGDEAERVAAAAVRSTELLTEAARRLPEMSRTVVTYVSGMGHASGPLGGERRAPGWARRLRVVYLGGNCELGTGSARFAVGALSVKPITAQLMSTPDRAVGGGCRGRVDAGEQVGPGGGQVEDDVLVDLALVRGPA